MLQMEYLVERLLFIATVGCFFLIASLSYYSSKKDTAKKKQEIIDIINEVLEEE